MSCLLAFTAIISIHHHVQVDNSHLESLETASSHELQGFRPIKQELHIVRS